MVPLALLVLLDQLELPAQSVLLVPSVMLDLLEKLAPMVKLVHLAPLDQWVVRVRKAHLAQLDRPALLVVQALSEESALQAHLAMKVSLDQSERLALMENLVLKVV